MTFIRKVKTKSGATAIQIVRKQAGRIVSLQHLGSAHTKIEMQALLALARDQLHRNQLSLFPEKKPSVLRLRLRRSSSDLLFRVLNQQYLKLGLGELQDPDFAYLCAARMVEPTSKLDSLRVLADLGITGLTKDRLYRCLSRIVANNYRVLIQNACFAAAASQALTLVLYDVTTLYFEIQKEDAYRKSGLSKERRLEPQIVIGLLVDQTGFPLSVQSFEGNMAETKTILPVLEAFSRRHHLSNITVVADAAMMSLRNLQALTQAGYTYIVGSRLNKIPYAIADYRKTQALTDQQIVVDTHQEFRIIYQYRAKRAALDLRNIQKQITKAQNVVSGRIPAHRAKFVTMTTKKKSLNQKLIDKAYALAGIKGYVTNLTAPDDQIVAAYHQLFQVEASFRMAKSDLKARPIFHWKREAIEAHLTVVLAALAVGRRVESRSQMSLKQLIKILRPIRSGVIVLNGQEYFAQEEISEDIHILLEKLGVGH